MADQEQLRSQLLAVQAKTQQNSESLKSVHRRMDEMAVTLREQGKLVVAVERLANGMSSLGEKVDTLGGRMERVAGRVDEIERKPARRVEMLLGEGAKLLLAALAGYFLKG